MAVVLGCSDVIGPVGRSVTGQLYSAIFSTPPVVWLTINVTKETLKQEQRVALKAEPKPISLAAIAGNSWFVES